MRTIGRSFPILFAAALTLLPARGAMAQAVTVQEVTVPAGTVNLPGVLFSQANVTARRPAVVLLHGCSGMWRNDVPHEVDPATNEPRVDQYLDKWGRQLASSGYVALAIDSYTPRRPDSSTEAAWQNQCGWNYDQGVSDTTVRPGDAEAAQAWLAARSDILAARIGLMGWSQGATAAMVALGATSISSNVLRPQATSKPFKVGIAFYPGCGFKNGASSWAFGGTSSSYWRPYRPFLVLHGTHDTLYDSQYDAANHTAPAYPSPLTSVPLRFNCEARVSRATTVYGASAANSNQALIQVMADAHHSYDYPHGTGFPAAPCPAAGHPADARAECLYDADALAFINSYDQ